MSQAFRRLGRTGVKVSPICLGTMNFGPHTSEEDSFAIMDAALERGINFFDTADQYSGWMEGSYNGQVEELLGRWLSQGGGRRESIVLASKVYNPMSREGRLPEPNRDTRCLSAMKIIRHTEDSLRRLQTDRIDLHQMHHIDRDADADEVLQAFDTLIKQGKVVYVGSSNFAGWDIATYCQEGRFTRLPRLISEQSVYNLANRTIELEVIPACRHYGLALLPWSPLAGGLLGGALKKKRDTGRSRGDWFDADLKKNHDAVAAYEKLCRELEKSPATVALAWLLSNPVVTAPIIGPRTMEQFTSALEAVDLRLDAETLDRLDEIWPGPGGEAPVPYAW